MQPRSCRARRSLSAARGASGAYARSSILIRGDGIFIEELEAELDCRGLPVPRSTGIRHWFADFDPDEELRRLEDDPELTADPRSRRIAVVADSLLEPLLDELGRDGFGFIQLPPSGLDRQTVLAWLEQVAEHVAEFRRNDYEVVLVDDGRYAGELAAALVAFAVPPLPQYAIQPPSTSRLTPET